VIFHVDPPSVADLGSEFEIQLRFRNAMKKLAPKVRLVATPNAGKRTQWEASRAKAEGLAKGFPDVTLMAEPKLTGYIEFKAKAGRLSPEQTEWLNFLTGAGFPCGCFNNVAGAVAAARAWGFPIA
jgi:hypothetical protein